MPTAPERTASLAAQHEVTIVAPRHSRMLLAGIRQYSLDARLRGHGEGEGGHPPI